MTNFCRVIHEQMVDLVLYPTMSGNSQTADDTELRLTAVQSSVPLMTNLQGMEAFCTALYDLRFVSGIDISSRFHFNEEKEAGMRFTS